MRQLKVFSTSLGPRPGAIVPTTSTGGVNSGNVSTLMRGVTTAANTTSAMATINTAMGLRRARPVTRAPASGRRPADASSGASSLLHRDGCLPGGLTAGLCCAAGRGRRTGGDFLSLHGVAVLQQGAAL